MRKFSFENKHLKRKIGSKSLNIFVLHSSPSHPPFHHHFRPEELMTCPSPDETAAKQGIPSSPSPKISFSGSVKQHHLTTTLIHFADSFKISARETSAFCKHQALFKASNVMFKGLQDMLGTLLHFPPQTTPKTKTRGNNKSKTQQNGWNVGLLLLILRVLVLGTSHFQDSKSE